MINAGTQIRLRIKACRLLLEKIVAFFLFMILCPLPRGNKVKDEINPLSGNLIFTKCL